MDHDDIESGGLEPDKQGVCQEEGVGDEGDAMPLFLDRPDDGGQIRMECGLSARQ